MDIYIVRNGKTRGPFAKDCIRGMLESGGVQPIDLAWTEKSGDWTPLYKIAGIVSLTPSTITGSGPRSTTRAGSNSQKIYSICLLLVGPIILVLAVAFLAFGPLDFHKLLRTIHGIDASADKSDSATKFPAASANQSEEEYCSKVVSILDGVGLKNIKKLSAIPKEFRSKRSVLAEQTNDSGASFGDFYASIAPAITIEERSLSFSGKRVVFDHIFCAERSGNLCVFAIDSSGNCIDLWKTHADEKQRFSDADCDLRWEGSHVFWILSKPNP